MTVLVSSRLPWRVGAMPLLAGVVAGAMSMSAAASGDRFHERGQEGWFWYEPEPEPLPEEEVRAPEPLPPPDLSISGEAETVEGKAGPASLSPAWFREHLDDFRDRAIGDPSPANVRAYLYLQRIALERASDFADATANAIIRDPWLDANTERPLATYAARAVDDGAADAQQQALQDLAASTGIMFFYEASCEPCVRQAGVLDITKRLYGFEILAVSLDGTPPPAPLTALRRDDGQAEQLGVVGVPALFLMRPPDLILPLAQAPLDVETLGRRIIMQAHGAGLIPTDTYLATRPLNRPFTLPGSFEDMPDGAMDDPALLVSYLRAKLGMGRPGEP